MAVAALPDSPPGELSVPSLARVVGICSIGAGLVHAAVVGAHGGHDGAVAAFVLSALFQVAWGAAIAQRPSRWLAAVGFVGNVACAVAYVVACTNGISFIPGLDHAEDPGFAGVIATVLEIVAAAGAGLLLVHRLEGRVRFAVPLAGLAVAALVGPAVAVGATDVHDHDATASGHVHDETVGDTVASQVHDHLVATGQRTGTDGSPTTVAATHDHTATATAKPFDPSLPIDLSGTPGVTPEEQARAEMLLTLTIARLPQWADTETAYAAGFRSIGDGLTGTEHYINWAWINDDRILDPDHPESLVYDVKPDGTRVLAAAMYMLAQGQTLDDVPDIGGPLMQWHIHDNLCFATDGDAIKVVGLTDANGNCLAGQKAQNPVPMIHVWIRPNECGPFASLEGVGAGQVKPGEQRLCDHLHGSA